MKYIFFLFPIFLQAQCLIPTHSYRLICADEVRYADSIASGSRLYISSKNAFVTSPRSVFSLVNGYGQHFIQVTNSANSQKVAINRAWINRIDSTSSNKALIYIKDISVTFTTTESYTAVKDSAIACFIRSVASGLATLSDGDYGDVVVSGGGLVMTVDKPDLGIHNLADGDFSVTADSTALSLTNTRAITLQTKNIDGWISRYLQTNNSLTLRANSSGKNSRIFVDTTGANFQFVNGANNASLRVGDSVAVRFNTGGSVGQVLTVTSIDVDGRLVINPKTGGSGTANCEQTLTKTSHGFRKWTPIYWNGSAWARPTFDSIIPTYIVVDSTSANTFKVSNCGNYTSTLTAGLYYYTGTSPGYSLAPTSIPTPIFEVAQSRLILQPLVGFNLAGGGGAGDVTRDELADSTAAIRASSNGIYSGSDSLSQTDTYVKMDADNTQSFGVGNWVNFPLPDDSNVEYGILISQDYTLLANKWAQLQLSPSEATLFFSDQSSPNFTNTSISLRDSSVYIEGVRQDTNFSYKLAAGSPSISSGVKQTMVWTGTGSSATVAFEMDNSLGNTNQTLTENRQIDADGFDLTHINLNKWTLSGDRFDVNLGGTGSNNTIELTDIDGEAGFILEQSADSTTILQGYSLSSPQESSISFKPSGLYYSYINTAGVSAANYKLFPDSNPGSGNKIWQWVNGVPGWITTPSGGGSSTPERVFLESSTATSVDLDAGTTVKDRDGSNTTFTFPSNLSGLRVYKNGQLLAETGTSTTRDYSCNTGTNVLTFTVALVSTDRVIIEK